MGLFGGGKKISINVPPPPRLPTAEELFSAGTSNARSTSPLAFGAREGALADLARGGDYYNQFSLTGRPLGEITPDYFSQFGPTTLEEALGNQYFQNIMPDVETNILHQLSLAGVANSPIAARLIAKQRGQTGFDVGSFLANQAQRRGELGLNRQSELAQMGEQRALNSLNYRNIDPFSMITPYVETGMNQSNAQAKIDYEYNLMKAQAELQNAIQAQQKKGAFGSTLGTIAGIGLGALTGGALAPAMSLISGPFAGMSAAIPWALGGGAIGGSLGGSLGNMFAGGGSETPIGFGDALTAVSAFNPPRNTFGTFGQTKTSAPLPVYSSPNSYKPSTGSMGRDYSFQDYVNRYGINPGY